MAQTTKKGNQIKHARRQCYERFGVILDSNTLAGIIEKIQSQQAEFIERQSNRVTLWRVEVGGRSMVVVYDSRRKNIATCLPREYFEEQE